MSALHAAINEWEDNQITWLLDHGAEVNELDEDGNTPLMLAVSRHLYIAQVRKLLDRGADLHTRDSSGRTPLMLALDCGSLQSIGELLEQYAVIGEKPAVAPEYDQGRLALLFAIYSNDVEAVDAMLTAGTDPNTKNQQGRTPLMLAVELGHAGVVTMLLKRGADVFMRETGRNLWTALHIAANHNQAECARVLLEHNADVDSRDEDAWTPLIWAAFSSSAPVSSLLLEYGADVHVEDAEGTSALSQAGWVGDEETIRTLLTWGAAANEKHLHDAFRAAFTDNNQDKTGLFLEAGLKIGLSEAVLMHDMDQITNLLAEGVEHSELNPALLMAVGHSSTTVVRLLLAHGADANAASRHRTALMRTYSNQYFVVDNIDALLQAGADMNARDENGDTAFTLRDGWYISEKSRIGLMRKMLKYGADVNTQNMEGTTALMHAVRMGEISVARFLLKCGARIDLHDKEGRTALMFAVAEGHTWMVRLLLKHGATVTDRATDGSTALSLAQRWIGTRIARMLMDAGA